MAALSLEHLNTITAKQESLWGTVSISLSEAVNRQTAFLSPLVTLLPLSELDTAFAGARVCCTVALEADASPRSLLLVLEDSAAATLADIAAGGDGSSPPKEVDENILQVMQQILFVIASGFAQAMTNLYGAECQVLQVETYHDSLQPPLDWLTQENLLRVDTVLQVDNSPIGVLSLLGDERFGLWLAGEQEPGAAPSATDTIAEQTPFQPLGEPEPAPSPFVPLAQSAAQPLPAGIELILDVPLEITVELGRKRMFIKEILELAAGSIVELDRVAGEPVDVLVNGRIMARGEVVVIEDNFGIRITEIINPQDQLVEISRRAVA